MLSFSSAQKMLARCCRVNARGKAQLNWASSSRRSLHVSPRLAVIRPFLLSDPGEGIKEVQIIQWFVEPGARVEQFSPICEVQSDKSVAEITSRFDGVIKKLHYEQDDVVQVGQALLDIDVPTEVASAEDSLPAPESRSGCEFISPSQPQKAFEGRKQSTNDTAHPENEESRSPKHHAILAAPAVRGLIKEFGIDVQKVVGTGKDGRVTKEDVQKYVDSRESRSPIANISEPSNATADVAQKETSIALSSVQSQMFKTMTRSLQIPHFVFADEVDVSAFSGLRRRMNNAPTKGQKLSYLHFVIKAVSMALKDFPLLNARVEMDDGNERPRLVMREIHNVGIAIDTPQGLLVPNIKDVSSLSMLDIAFECSRLQSLAKDGKLSSKDLTGGTITVSNIGSIGGTYVAPVIVQSEVAILGVGKMRTIPAFDDQEHVMKKDIMNFSWSADHRVIDGATMARMHARVAAFIEDPASMLSVLR